MTLCHFLLVYDLERQELVEQREFSDGEQATLAYTELEREHGGDRNKEIVLVGADSIETIRSTHAHYFARDVDRVASRYLTGV